MIEERKEREYKSKRKISRERDSITSRWIGLISDLTRCLSVRLLSHLIDSRILVSLRASYLQFRRWKLVPRLPLASGRRTRPPQEYPRALRPFLGRLQNQRYLSRRMLRPSLQLFRQPCHVEPLPRDLPFLRNTTQGNSCAPTPPLLPLNSQNRSR